MPANKRATTGRWRALRGFGFAANSDVRKRQRALEEVPPDERGPNVEIAEGEIFSPANLPDDVREVCLKYAEPVKEKKGKKGVETDG